jgi:adenylate cyclase
MKNLLTNRWLHTLLLLGLLAGAVVVRYQDYDWLKSLRYLAFDTYNKLSPREATNDAVVVDIDEASLAREDLGQWPWSRDVMAKLVDNLTAMGAKAIVFDMVFAEYDRTSSRALLERIPEAERTEGVIATLKSIPDNDDLFAQAIKNSGRTVMGFIWSQQKEATRRLPVQSKPILLGKGAKDLEQTVPLIVGAATPIEELGNAAAGNGNFGVMSEVDGLIRRVPLLFRYKDEASEKTLMYPSLALEGLRVATDPREVIKVRALKKEEAGAFDPPYKMSVGKLEIPMDRDGQIYVWFSYARPSEYIPAWQIIRNETPQETIKDKIVFVGTSAEGLKDIRSTPLNLLIPGVELHVNVVEQVLSSRFLLRPELVQGIELCIVLIMGLFIIFVAPFIGAVLMTLLVTVLIGALTLGSMYGFITYGLLIDPVYPGLSLMVLLSVATILSYIRTEAERKQVRQAFGFYISPDVMKELEQDSTRLKLGGETRDLSVMFTDIRNFTSISETMPPEALIQLMNDFLTPMSDLVMAHRGTIDKYMGDAMMAFWNAPLDDPDHARHACLTALKMNEALAPINKALEARAQTERRTPILLQAGIGINSGSASVGNMGSHKRFAYSALGDTVNLASRLEGQTKTYGVDILIGQETQKQVSDFATLELDLLRVKGKQEPVRVFTLLGDDDFAKDTFYRDWKALHEQMLHHYRNADFTTAERMVRDCQRLASGNMADFYTLYLHRIKALKETPPPNDWDGVFVATSK